MFKVFLGACVDFVTGDKNYKSGADWVTTARTLQCFFVRSKRENADAEWVEISRGLVMEISVDMLPEKVKDFCLFYGMKQLVADRKFAMSAKLFTKELERDRINAAEEFLKEMEAIQDIPAKRASGNAKARQKEKDSLTQALSKAIFSGDFALAKTITEEMREKGFVEDGNATPAPAQTAVSSAPVVVKKKKTAKK